MAQVIKLSLQPKASRLSSQCRVGCVNGIHERDRGLVADGTVRPILIVVSAPILQLFAGVRKRQEPVGIQAIGSERP